MAFTHSPAVLKEAAQLVGWRIEERDGEAMKVPHSATLPSMDSS